MRFFELLIIVIGLVFLLDSIFIKSSKKFILYAYMVAAAITTTLHLVLENYRWAMIPAYLIILLLYFMCIKRLTSPIKNQKKSKLIVKIIFSAAAFILVLIYGGFTIASPLMLPVFSFDNPASEYIIGSMPKHLIDASRKDIPFNDSNRELMIQVWYPAQKSGDLQRMSYYPYTGMSEAFSEMLGYPKFFFNNLDLIKTNSYLNAKLSDQQVQYPVLIFSHGFRDTRFHNTYQIEELVRNGYIVIGIDHTHYTSLTVFPDDHVTKVDVDKSELQYNKEEIEKMENIWLKDAEFVLNQIEIMNKNDSFFAGRLDLEKVGYFGHSIGGATALRTILKDDRIKAAINMDGFIPGYNNEPADKPVMIMMHDPQTDKGEPGSKEYKLFKDSRDSMYSFYNNSKEPAYIISIKKTVHMSFTDISLLTRIFNLNLTAPERCFEIINEYTVSFFDKFLKNKDNGTLEGTTSKYEEVTFIGNKAPIPSSLQ